MTNQNARRLELFVQAKQLRFRMVRTAITLGLTLINLAHVEGSVGNEDRASWAAENARKVHQQVQDCLSTTELSAEEMQWAIENLNQLEQAIGSGGSSQVGDSLH
jgi:hypothetical protein